jgi:uncharacterized glyoxalase superfamily protein PhnB
MITNVNSENAEDLIRFYQETVGLERDPNSGGFLVGDGMFVVDGHSEIKGQTKEPARVLVNFVVDDLPGEEQRLKDAGVECIRSQGREFWGGVISTFVDPDGNYFQLMYYNPEEAPAE